MIYPVGQRVNGQINNITDLGIFVSLDQHHSGLVHHSDFGQEWPLAQRRYEVGQTVRVVVDRRRGRQIGLSLNRVNDDQLVDPTNDYRNLAPADFERVLEKLVRRAEQENHRFAKLIADEH
ncbi:MAG: S1 RNA-binding domain-containing protein [Lactobacillus sp.]|jgi:predicted RNA-binding protein with RPS1 domain|nr:S1 RNA-binding domain-containing protein [Lactobacillus sp.]